MDSSTALPGDERARAKLVHNIRLICDRIVRSRKATNRWQVKYHRVLRIASLILSTVGGSGLIATNVIPGGADSSSWGFWFSVVSVVLGILLQVSNELGIEQTALQAQAAVASFLRIDTSLEIVLTEENPVKLVGRLLEETNGLLLEYSHVIPRSSDAMDLETAALLKSLVEKHGSYWVLPQPRMRKREKP